MPTARLLSSAPSALRSCLCAVLAAVSVAGANAAFAAGPSSPWSVGIGVGADRGRVDCVASFACDRSSTAVKLFAGYRVSDPIELQAILFDAGNFKGGDTTPLGTQFGGTFKVSGIGLTGGYRWPFASDWSLVGRAGIAGVRTRFDYANDLAASVGKTTVQPLLGLGVGYAITPALRLGLDYDLTRFKVHVTRGSLQTLGLAAQYSF